MKNNQKMVVYVWPNKQKEKDGLQPLYVRISIDGKATTFATRFIINPLHWNKLNQSLKLNAPNSQKINAYLDRLHNAINQDYLGYMARGVNVTSRELKNNFLGIVETPQTRTLIMAIEYHNQKFMELVNSGRVVHSTWKKYNTSRNKIASFLKNEYRVNDIALSELSYAFVVDFEHYLLTKEHLQTNTVSKTIKHLKKIARMCVDNQWMEANPFERFKCAYKAPEREVLTQQEINQLFQTRFISKALEEARDIFVFCCYTGFAFAEVYNFKPNDLAIGIDGEFWLTTHRQKTGERESVPLLPLASTIVEKYKTHPRCLKKEKLLPVKTNQVYNRELKEVAILCGLDKILTSHIARHTFATTVTLSNGVPIETVSKMLGHSRIATTQIYAKVVDTKVSMDMKALKEKLHPELIVNKIISERK